MVRSISFRDPTLRFFLWSRFIKPYFPFEWPDRWCRLCLMDDMQEPRLLDGNENQSDFWNDVHCKLEYRDCGYV